MTLSLTDTFTYCLLRKHLHLVIETPPPKLVAGMKGTEADHGARRTGEPRKVEVARELRSKRTVASRWVSERLAMGHLTRGKSGDHRPEPANCRSSTFPLRPSPVLVMLRLGWLETKTFRALECLSFKHCMAPSGAWLRSRKRRITSNHWHCI
jgi:hypothetical protein